MKLNIALIGLMLAVTLSAAARQEVPEKYKSLFNTYESGLKRYNAYLDRTGTKAKDAVCFGAELLAANSNRGAELLQPRALKGVELSLQRFSELGIQGATIAVGYPVLSDDLPESKEYLAFYKRVAALVRSRHMKLCVKIHVLFSGTVYSPLKFDFSSLSVEKLTRGKRVMAERILRELAPDYLTLGGEPDTEAKLTGLKELNDPAVYSNMVKAILLNLERGNTQVGVGQGTWITPDFARQFAATDIDFINIHIYPFGKKSIDVLNQICATAHAAKKRLVLDECWLYKIAPGEGIEIAASAAVYRRDAYAFWEPVDRLFLESIAKIAIQNGFEYVSPFWSHCFFCQIPYGADDEGLSYKEFNDKYVSAVSGSLQSGTSSSLGRYYSELIRRCSSAH